MSQFVAILLLYDLIVFLGAIVSSETAGRRRETTAIGVLFFFSGMPALVYQIVWQRALFSIYGVNAESVAVAVAAFMLGLGLGSLLGGWLSSCFPRQAIVLFGIAELGVAAFGLASLHIFHWVARYTAGSNLPSTIVFSISLLIIPTMLMGTTLPLLVEHLVRFSGRVGYSVALLYFVNTFGSAAACFFCATFLLRDFGQSGSIFIAASLNTLVGVTAVLLGRSKRAKSAETDVGPPVPRIVEPIFPIAPAMLIAGLSGFMALGFEMVWFRVFSLASSDRAPAFALLLSTYLAGIAVGSYIGGKLTEGKAQTDVLRIIGYVMLTAGAVSPYLAPLIATLKWKNISFLPGAVGFFVTAALLGSVLPLVCKLAVAGGVRAGRDVSFVYVANILGSTLGTLVIGFVLLNHFGLRQVSFQLGMATVVVGGVVLTFGQRKLTTSPVRAIVAITIALGAVPLSLPLYSGLFEKLIFGASAGSVIPFAHVVENRNGVIAVTRGGAVFGNGVYDGYFNIDPLEDSNKVVRAYSLSAFHPAPKRMLEIGLSSGSWAQILANHPRVESLDIVEINPGYLKLIPQYAMVKSLLENPKVDIHIDDGRRWLLAHPGVRYDVIVENTSFYWRDHSSDLLSVGYLRIIRRHLNSGGVYFYNTTGSDDVVATGLRVFPYGLRVLNFLAVSDSPIAFDKSRWISILGQYTIDNRLVFDPSLPKTVDTLAGYGALADSLHAPPTETGLETSESENARLGNRLIITDDNMGWEWR
jgi:predicted membrane-bound spermidine synthase